ncbi:response regulator [bacterium]|nr:response regulator [bacterium]
MKILIVDNDKSIIETIEELLEVKGYHEYMTAENGMDGLEKFHNYNPDLILTDIVMPKKNGLDLLKKVKRENPETIVIIVTCAGSTDNIVKALEFHADNFLKKPFEPRQLEKLLIKYKKIISDKEKLHDIEHHVTSSEMRIDFENDIFKIGSLVNFLIRQCGSNIGCEEKHKVRLGLYELIMNAVEHGNFGITYEDKTRLLRSEGDEDLRDYYKQKMSDPEFNQRKVNVRFCMNMENLEWTISDEGEGFDWKNIKNPMEDGHYDFHDRGIYLAKYQFDEMEYLGNGNVVRVCKKRQKLFPGEH